MVEICLSHINRSDYRDNIAVERAALNAAAGEGQINEDVLCF